MKAADMNGREISCVVFPPPVRAGEDYDSMVYYCEYLGEYSIDWIQCFNGGVLAAQFNVRYVESIYFVEEKPELEEECLTIPDQKEA